MRSATICLLSLLLPTTLIAQGDDRYVLSLGSATLAPGATADVSVRLDVVPGTSGPPSSLQGWAYGVCSDPTAVQVVSVVDGLTTATINGGGPPGFNAINCTPMPGSGFTIGVVIDLFSLNFLAPGTGYELNVATYDDAGMGLGSSTTLDFCTGLGTPPVDVLMVELGGNAVIPLQSSGALHPVDQFIRGDVNGDGAVNVPDAIALARALFGVGPALACDAVGDVNDDDSLNMLHDPMALLMYLFQGGPAPVAPFPTCGIDPTPGALSTCSASMCP